MKHILKSSLIILIIFTVFLNIYLICCGYDRLVNYRDGLEILGLALVFLGLLVLIGGYGAFNIFGYSFYYIAGSRKRTEERRYENYQDYIEKKEAKNKGKHLDFLAFEFVGVFFYLISLFLNIFL